MAMSYGDDGILRIEVKEGAVIDREEVKMQNETIERLGVVIPYVALVDARASFTITKAGQELSASYSNLRIATAVVTGNPVTRMLSNAYVALFKPAHPIKLFSSVSEAEGWLKKQLIANER